MHVLHRVTDDSNDNTDKNSLKCSNVFAGVLGSYLDNLVFRTCLTFSISCHGSIFLAVQRSAHATRDGQMFPDFNVSDLMFPRPRLSVCFSSKCTYIGPLNSFLNSGKHSQSSSDCAKHASLFLAERIFRRFFFLAPPVFFSQILSPDFFSFLWQKCPEKSFLENL